MIVAPECAPLGLKPIEGKNAGVDRIGLARRPRYLAKWRTRDREPPKSKGGRPSSWQPVSVPEVGRKAGDEPSRLKGMGWERGGEFAQRVQGERRTQPIGVRCSWGVNLVL